MDNQIISVPTSVKMLECPMVGHLHGNNKSTHVLVVLESKNRRDDSLYLLVFLFVCFVLLIKNRETSKGNTKVKRTRNFHCCENAWEMISCISCHGTLKEHLVEELVHKETKISN